MTIAAHSSSNQPWSKRWLHQAWIRLKEASKQDHSTFHYKVLYGSAPSHLFIVLNGQTGNIIVDGLLGPASSDKVYWIKPGQRVEMHYSSIGTRELYLFPFEAMDLEASRAEEQEKFSPVSEGMPAASPSELLTLCEKIFDHWHSGDEVDRFASQAGFQELLHLLFKKQGQHEEALDRVNEYMKHNYWEPVTVGALSEMAGMSRYYFMRSFKDRFGQSAMDYLTELRTNQAKKLLEEGFPLWDIVDKIGYKDPQYFSSQFNKNVGISPRTYTLNRRCKVAAYSWPNIGHLLTLQVIPYAAPIDQFWSDDYRKKYRFDVKHLLSHDYKFNLEALRRSRPDRIVALDEMLPEEEKQKLRQIAPVLFLPWHTENWRKHLQLTAQFLEREKEGERWLARYDQQVENVTECMPMTFKQGTLLIISITSRGINVWGRRAGTVLYDDLGLTCAPGVETIEFTEYVQMEQLAAYDADSILIHVLKDRDSQSEWEHLQRSEAWRTLRAVRSGNVYHTSGQAWLAEPILEYTANRHDHMLQELNALFRAQ
ncbi:helix-turn-helix domain-containing protein [Paenibacillus gorillae]|uniref:helix-turn-helix domain-containing protein n=1 Tax=Paenibacillus gorillae TaxID=1243662 RepID=UPI0004B7C980|nr:helix-turn-helix domain-containing protein [Paenibacillus gorillae]